MVEEMVFSFAGNMHECLPSNDIVCLFYILLSIILALFLFYGHNTFVAGFLRTKNIFVCMCGCALLHDKDTITQCRTKIIVSFKRTEETRSECV